MTEDVSLLKSPWTDSLRKLLSEADEDLLIACPFVKREGTDHILAQLERRTSGRSVKVRLITDLRPESVLAGSMDMDALVDLGTHLPNFSITHLPGIHAKVYVADSKIAIVTSGNLTRSGLRGNVEYGVELKETTIVRQVRADIEEFGCLGAEIPVGDVAELSLTMSDLKALFSRAQKTIKREARRVFQDRLEEAQIQLLRHRVRGGTSHAVFSDTIKFLLGNGPLRTSEMHPLIQSIHPDLCDDSVDRTIDGVNFGKKWKHHVRSAQQHLKRQREITFDGDHWHLGPPQTRNPPH